ncbi:MAG: helix-turn-helix domain-containing protein [Firmicutes bacterium]|nr:helix-turn-helix domain-containing protein [Bacillota bacterium]
MFKDIIKDLRRQKNLTQEELAKALDCTHSRISYWESGKRLPDYDALKRLSLFFDVPADYLLGITDEDGTRLII